MSANVSMPIATQSSSTTSSLQDSNALDNVDDTSPSAPLLEQIEEQPSLPTRTNTTYSFAGNALCNDDNGSRTTNTKGTTENQDQTSTTDGGKEKKDEPEDSLYECNICLDTAKDAVVSLCGHLFCWPCLHQWMQTRPNRKMCPVCKAAISKEKVIPLYGRNSTQQEDPRNKIPPRPAGQRSEPESPNLFQSFGLNNFHMSFGIGVFPFGYFSVFNFGEPRPPAANRGTTQYDADQELSKLFLGFAFICLLWLLFA